MALTDGLQPAVTIKVEEEEVSDVKGCYIWLSESAQSNLLEENTLEEQKVSRPKKRNCAVVTCPNYFYKRTDQPLLSFHSFPKDERIREIWVKLCKRPIKFSANCAHICSDHFKPDDYVRNAMVEYNMGRRNNRLKPGAIPSRNLPVLEIETNSSSGSFPEENILKKQEELIILSDAEAGSSPALDRLNSSEDNEVTVSMLQDIEDYPEVITVSSDEESNDSVKLKKDADVKLKKDAEERLKQLFKEKKLRLLKLKYQELEKSFEELKVKTNKEIEKLDNILHDKEEEYNGELREVLSVFLKPEEVEAVVRQARW